MSPDSFAALPPVRLPDQVYVPVAEPALDAGEIRLELRQATDGEVVALVYSSLDAVIHCCGEHQPWVLVPAQRMVTLQQELSIDRIVLDLSLAEGQRHRLRGRAHDRE